MSEAGYHTYPPLVFVESTPYGNYYRAFANCLFSTSKLLIVGYGGGDEHINTWLREYVGSIKLTLSLAPT
jgi:hypothetical protein